jgi:hypothetical protein
MPILADHAHEFASVSCTLSTHPQAPEITGSSPSSNLSAATSPLATETLSDR